MRAARIFEDLTVGIEDIKVPEPGPDEILVRINAAGVCGTELHIVDGMIKPDPYPMTLGHEGAGVIETAGPGTKMEPGTRVAIYNKLFCGACAQCLRGRTNLCDREPDQLGFNRDGTDAEYALIPERNAVPLPEGVSFAEAAVLTCAGMTAIHAARLSHLLLGETAVVNGIGGVGSLVVQAARGAGARVIAVADSDEKAKLARELGAQETVVISTPEEYADLPSAVKDLSGHGADVFFELVGTTATMTAGIRCLAKGGRFVSTGYTDQSLDIHPIEFILPETSLVSTVAATRLDLEDALQLAADGTLRVPIAHRYPLEGLSDALAALRSRSVLGRQVLELV
jgi:propanol-preferring alcohol dehydrogenase